MSRTDGFRLRWLRAFIATVDCGSQSDAAKHLGVSQSTISKDVTSLEEWLRYQLFESSVPVELSAKGAAFLPQAKDIVDKLEKAREPLQAQQPSGTPIRDIKP
jgi:DNA-binding transcriptional LysR family regulator|tara:strand:- start:8295 stop:8603 length:309 start_codon:yes stop_codon:yes gene_type:complete